MDSSEFEKAIDILIYYDGHMASRLSAICYNLMVRLDHENEELPPSKLLQDVVLIVQDANAEVGSIAKELLEIEGLTASALDFAREFLPTQKEGLVRQEFQRDYDATIKDVKLLQKLTMKLEQHLQNIQMLMGTPNFVQEHYDVQSGAWKGQVFDELRELSEKFEQVKNNFEEFQNKKVYLEHFLKDLLRNTYKLWQVRFQNRSEWLYHATSSLFLPNIQKYGLDPLKMSEGIKRAILTISGIYERHGIRTGDSAKVAMDLVQRLEERKVYLSIERAALVKARAENVPAFLYELLDEKSLKEDAKAALLSALTEKEKFSLRAIWRFSKLLRNRNRMVLLLIKMDSNFLKYYGVPDFLSNYDEFVKCFMGEMPTNTKTRLLGQPYGNGLGRAIYWLIPSIGGAGNAGPIINSLLSMRDSGLIDLHRIEPLQFDFQVDQVPPEFIYVKLSGKLLPISQLSEEMLPLIAQ